MQVELANYSLKRLKDYDENANNCEKRIADIEEHISKKTNMNISEHGRLIDYLCKKVNSHDKDIEFLQNRSV